MAQMEKRAGKCAVQLSSMTWALSLTKTAAPTDIFCTLREHTRRKQGFTAGTKMRVGIGLWAKCLISGRPQDVICCF
jgi:hypothetical protein